MALKHPHSMSAIRTGPEPESISTPLWPSYACTVKRTWRRCRGFEKCPKHRNTYPFHNGMEIPLGTAGEVQDASHLQISDVKNPRQQNCAGVELKRQEQILGMVRHLLKTIALIEIDCGVLRIDDKANTANLTGNTSRSVNGVKDQELSNAFPLMA